MSTGLLPLLATMCLAIAAFGAWSQEPVRRGPAIMYTLGAVANLILFAYIITN